MDTVIEQLKASLGDTGRYYEPPEGFDTVDEGQWVQEHKSQRATSIVAHPESGRHFEVHQCRQGSYHTDWYHSQPELGAEVALKKVVVTTEVWTPTTHQEITP